MPAQSGMELACRLMVELAGRMTNSLIRVIFLMLLLNIKCRRIGLIVVPPKSVILRRIVKNRGIIIVRICT